LLEAARVRKGMEVWNYIINEINAAEPDLSPDNPVWKANKLAAKVLLMKCYLNKAVYINRNDPKPEPVDMNNVISLADAIINTNRFKLWSNYFDNFAPDNTNIGKENIFTQRNDPYSNSNNFLFIAYGMVLHSSQGPSYGNGGNGANGFTTLSDFYDKFDPADLRRGTVYHADGAAPDPGQRINVGFLSGQQYDLFTDAPLKNDNGIPVIFTREVKNLELDPKNKDFTGIRPLKYFPDFNNYWGPDNDYVFFRFSDVLLMKAEAIQRGGIGTNAGSYGNTAKDIVNAIRTHPSRNASLLSSVNLDILLDERGRELWWEGWRRQDLIRFGKFLQPFQEKSYTSDPKYLLFPIPADQVAVNPNLKQNPGY
jgi:hypothetical protein